MMEGWGVAMEDEEVRLDVIKVILYELNTTIGPQENRLAALKAALSKFNHSDQAKHDQELDLQADKIIFQKLAFSFSINKASQEVGLLASALEMVYRGSRARVALSFNEIGESILPLFVLMIQGPPSFSTSPEQTHDQTTDSDSMSQISGNDKEHELGPISEEEDESVNTNMTHIAIEKLRRPIVSSSSAEENTLRSTNTDVSQAGKLPEESRSRRVRFVDTIETELEKVDSHDEESFNTNPHAVRKILKILRYYSRVLSAMIPMAHHPGLLDALIFQLQRGRMKGSSSAEQSSEKIYLRSFDGDEEDTSIGNDYSYDGTSSESRQMPQSSNRPIDLMSTARVDAIATIVNLACAEENKSKMLYHPGLLDAVILAAKKDPSEEAREHAAIVLMNLAFADSNKLHMASQDQLLDILINLVEDESPFTRRYASSALFTLACVEANTVRMARYGNGQLLTALTRVLLNDPADEARINAAEALFNMARNNTEDTVEIMGNHSDVLPALAKSVLSDYSADVRAYSARALEWLAADIHSSSKCHRKLLDALTIAAAWTKTTCIAEALKSQSTLPENRKSMVEHEGLLNALANLAALEGMHDDEVRTCAITTIEQLTLEASSRLSMARHEGIMTALTRATFNISDAWEDVDNESRSAKLMTKSALKNLAEVL